MRRRDRAARRRPRALIAALAAVACLAAVAGALAALGRYETDPGRVLGTNHPPPAWTRPCWVLHSKEASGPFSAPCARVRGTVLYVQRRDPDGDGDRHMLVLAGTHLVTIKYRRGVRTGRLPGIGSTVSVVGRRLPRSGIAEVEPGAPAR